MSFQEFDAIIDDCFLYGAAIARTRKYEQRINFKAVKLISDILEKEETNFKAA